MSYENRYPESYQGRKAGHIARRDDDFFPGLRRSRDLLRRTSQESLDKFGKGDALTRSEEWPSAPLSEPSRSENDHQKNSKTYTDYQRPRESAEWPNGIPPTGPRSYRADVSPPASRRSSLQINRPSFRRKGDSWRPTGEYQQRYRSPPVDRSPRDELNPFEANFTEAKTMAGQQKRQSLELSLRHVYKPYQPPANKSAGHCDPVLYDDHALTQRPGSSRHNSRENGPVPTVRHENFPEGQLIRTRSPTNQVTDRIMPVKLPQNKQRNQHKPVGLQLALANKSNLQDDTHSIRSEGSTSSGKALSGRSSTTSKPQTTRCYACKDSKIVAEQAERAESLENYVSCAVCSRRYHTRCARGYERDNPWTCRRCITKGPRNSTNESLSERRHLNSPLSHQTSYDRSKNLLKEGDHFRGKETIPTSVAPDNNANFSQQDSQRPQIEARTTTVNTTWDDPIYNSPNRLDCGLKHLDLIVSPESTISEKMLPEYLRTWGARDHESQSASRPPSIPSRKGSEEVTTAKTPQQGATNSGEERAVHSVAPSLDTPLIGKSQSADDAAFPGPPALRVLTQPDRGKQNNGLTTSACSESSTLIDVDGSERARAQTAKTQDVHNGVLAQSPMGQSQLRLRSTEGDKIAEAAPSREQSYSPPPVPSPRNGNPSFNMTSRKCTKCNKTIMSRSDICSKCQGAVAAANRSSMDRKDWSIPPSPSNNSKSRSPTNSASLVPGQPSSRKNFATAQPSESPRKRRQVLDGTANDHIFAPSKKARLEYVPPKDKSAGHAQRPVSNAKAKVVAKKSANNTGPSHKVSLARLTTFPNVQSTDSIASLPSTPDRSQQSKDAATQTVTGKTDASQGSQVPEAQALLEEKVEEAAHQAARANDLEQKLAQLRKREQQARSLANQSQQAKENAEDAERAFKKRIEKLEAQRKADLREIERLHNISTSRFREAPRGPQVVPKATSPSNKGSRPAAGRPAQDEQASAEEHKRALEAKGIIFESDSDDESSPDLPQRTYKQQPRDPLWQRPKISKDLFAVAPKYLQENSVSDAFLEAKRQEIAARPSRKQTFGKTLGLKIADRRLDRHQSVNRRLEERMMKISILEEGNEGSSDEHIDVERLLERSFEDVVGMPKEATPFVHKDKGQLAFRDGTTLRDGRVTRAKDMFLVGQ